MEVVVLGAVRARVLDSRGVTASAFFTSHSEKVS